MPESERAAWVARGRRQATAIPAEPGTVGWTYTVANSATQYLAAGESVEEKFTVTIEGLNWKDIQDLELLDLPKEGETVETRYGTCIVTEAELHPDSGERAGRIVCRLP